MIKILHLKKSLANFNKFSKIIKKNKIYWKVNNILWKILNLNVPAKKQMNLLFWKTNMKIIFYKIELSRKHEIIKY